MTVRLHGAFSELAGGARSAAVEAADVAGALAGLVARHPALGERLRDEHGRLRTHLSIFANDEDIRFQAGEATALVDGDTVHVIPAVSGGEGSTWRGA